jgi:hypothetical protein
MGAGVSFLMRMKPNLRAYKEVVSGHLDGLESGENAVMRSMQWSTTGSSSPPSP